MQYQDIDDEFHKKRICTLVAFLSRKRDIVL